MYPPSVAQLDECIMNGITVLIQNFWLIVIIHLDCGIVDSELLIRVMRSDDDCDVCRCVAGHSSIVAILKAVHGPFQWHVRARSIPLCVVLFLRTGIAVLG